MDGIIFLCLWYDDYISRDDDGPYWIDDRQCIIPGFAADGLPAALLVNWRNRTSMFVTLHVLAKPEDKISRLTNW
ncbi:uncharacterized protein CBL_04721 [Carabus blaptoides fortunei]